MISKLCVVSATTLLPSWAGCVCTLSAPGASLAPDTGVAGRVPAHFLRGLSLPAGSGRGRPCEALLLKLRPPTSPHSETSLFSVWAILQYKQKGERRMKTQKVTGRPLSHGQVQIPRPQQCRGRTHNLVHAHVCACVRAQPEDAGLSATCSGAVQRPPVPPHSSPRERPDPRRDSHVFSLPTWPSAPSQWRNHVAWRGHQAPHGRAPCHLRPGTRPSSTRLDPPVQSGLGQGHRQGTQHTHSGHSEERPGAQ